LPLDNQDLLNFLDSNRVSSSTLKESMAFKKIKTILKTTTLGLVHQSSFLLLKYSFSSILDLIGFKLLTNLLKSQQPECKPKP
jgi:hypothetical protein